jgi:hypothetical protein
MAPYSKLELPYAQLVADAILESSAFRQWLLAGTKHENGALQACPIGVIQGSLRSSGLKNPYWFNYYCSKDAKCACRIGTGIETDILLILDCANDRRLGLHIEIKGPDGRLENGQAESYPLRAACWANPNTRPKYVWPHEDFLTMLICGRELESDGGLQFFDKVVFHDDLVTRIPGYPEVSPPPRSPGHSKAP